MNGKKAKAIRKQILAIDKGIVLKGVARRLYRQVKKDLR